MRIKLFSQSNLQHLAWMVASLLLALAIWVAANMAENPVEKNEINNVAVEVKLPNDFVITDRDQGTMVTAIVRAPRADWDYLAADDIIVTANLRDVKEPGTYRVELEAEVTSGQHGTIVAIRPSTWTLTVDRRMVTTFPLEVVIIESPPLGYTHSREYDCDVDEIVVSGSAERVGAVARVEARLDLSDAVSPVTRTVNLTPVQESGLRARDVELTPAQVTCTIDVQLSQTVTPVEILPDRGTTTPPHGYTFQGYASIEPRRVGLTGDQDAIAALNSVVRTAIIDLTGKTDTFTIEVPLILPDGVFVEGDPFVRVEVLITPVVDSREFPDVPVKIIGLDEAAFRAAGLPTTVTVNVTGPQVRLPDLTVDDIRVEIDLTGLAAGAHQVIPKARVIGQPDEAAFSVSSVLPELFNVTLETINPTPTPRATLFPVFPPGDQ